MEATDGAVARNPQIGEALSPQEICVLRTVGRHEYCVMGMIARRIRLSLSGVTSLIDRLCERRLVRRDRSSDDRRVVQVELTDQGRVLHAADMATQVEFARGALKALSVEEQETLLGLIGKISDRIKAQKEKS